MSCNSVVGLAIIYKVRLYSQIMKNTLQTVHKTIYKNLIKVFMSLQLTLLKEKSV